MHTPDAYEHMPQPSLALGTSGRDSIGLGLSQRFAWRARIPHRRANASPWLSTTVQGSADAATASRAATPAASPGIPTPAGAALWQPYQLPDSVPRGMEREPWLGYGPSFWPEPGANFRVQQQQHQHQHQHQQQQQPVRLQQPQPQQEQYQRPLLHLPVTWYDGWGQPYSDEVNTPTTRVKIFTAGSGAGPFGEMHR